MANTIEARVEALENNGVDTSKIFNVFVDTDLPENTTLNVRFGNKIVSLSTQELTDDSIAQDILKHGWIANNKLHRRWITAQYLRMLDKEKTIARQLNESYTFGYMFNMLINEAHTLYKMECDARRGKDSDVFEERKQFFNTTVFAIIIDQWITNLKGYARRKYKYHPSAEEYNNFKKAYIDPAVELLNSVSSTDSFLIIEDALKRYAANKRFIPRNKKIKKPKAWVNRFQKAGAYYTLKNLIMFHDVALSTMDGVFSKEAALEYLKEKTPILAGYQLHAIVKKTVADNEFDLATSIEEHMKEQ